MSKCGYNSFEFLDICKNAEPYLMLSRKHGHQAVVFTSFEKFTDAQQQIAEIAVASGSQVDKDETFTQMLSRGIGAA
jgi:hypothetical protein